MIWLTPRELLVIRRHVTERLPIRTGIVNPAGIYSAVRRPFTAFGGHELYPTLLDKVAALIHSLIAFHPFAEGNESTALLAGDVCLRLNGRRLRPAADAAVFLRSVARGEREVAEISTWLENSSELIGHA